MLNELKDTKKIDFHAASTASAFASASILQILVAIPPTNLEAVNRTHTHISTCQGFTL